MKCGIALKVKEYTNGLSREDVNELFNVLETNEAFPIELESRNTEFTAVGFIPPPQQKSLSMNTNHQGWQIILL